jgi:hypothetical protein
MIHMSGIAWTRASLAPNPSAADSKTACRRVPPRGKKRPNRPP